MISSIKRLARKLPGISDVIADRDRLLVERDSLSLQRNALAEEREQLAGEVERLGLELDRLQKENAQGEADVQKLSRSQGFVPPGHFYSPIPSIEQVRQDADRIFGDSPRSLAGLDLNEAAQRSLLEKLAAYYPEMPFTATKQAGLRYYFENPAYGWSDGILLYCMIRLLQPRKIIEIGSGFSSCMMLDTNDLFCDGTIETAFIEPYPELLESLLRKSDSSSGRVRIIPARVQDVDLAEFSALEANDILFVDSTHVSKIDSDVNRILFEVLPSLAPGVYVHFHDIFYPFEYPREWVLEGRAWNEAYILRAFLQFNSGFSVVLMSTFMEHFHKDFFRERMPLCLKNPGGSLWLRKE
jgi:predicted O-methyltransferase YrrM